MADFTVRQGDNFTILDTLADAAGAPVDIQNATVKLTLIPAGGGAPLLDAVAATNAQNGNGSSTGRKGRCRTAAASPVAVAAGFYLGSWIVTYAGGAVQTFPNGGYILFEVTADAPVSSGVRFAESTALEARLGITFTADEHIRANRLLADASDEIRSEFGTISLVTDDVFTRPGTTDERIELPEVPVVAVTSVLLDGAPITDWYQVGNAIVRGRNLTIIDGVGSGYGWLRSFGSEAQTLTITYTHGYADVPATGQEHHGRDGRPCVGQPCIGDSGERRLDRNDFRAVRRPAARAAADRLRAPHATQALRQRRGQRLDGLTDERSGGTSQDEAALHHPPRRERRHHERPRQREQAGLAAARDQRAVHVVDGQRQRARRRRRDRLRRRAPTDDRHARHRRHRGRPHRRDHRPRRRRHRDAAQHPRRPPRPDHLELVLVEIS
jgi:hypothetical protein